MPRFVKPRVPGLLVAAAAVAVVAMSGSAVAASLITSAQIQDGTIKLKDISKKTRTKLQGNAGPQGPQGPKGDQGPQGETGAPGPATGAAGGALAGSYPNPTLAPELDRLTPVAAFVFAPATGAVSAEVHRAPQTGAPVVSHDVAGQYTVDLPGVDFRSQDDVASCTTNTDLIVGITSVGDNMRIYSRDAAGVGTDAGRMRCVVYDLS
jgi:hypothetical protein